ncbi:colicin secretion ATP binding protein (plasmid) [Candidatus Photodesmus blepharus]|uniref:Colicin secretion ATP binding protein n=1 Tax=Candidatus Photodesmus blepharonis TaxID=1179155 RepID=A0A084CMD0_9GAMM|nr:peptidase domain-containing ABC transporter [Candidatus Photodesmus blepharus]KEY90959.1 colicin secretion ATP binding protein [Candidatus Photodesmus blepharus]
MKKIFFGLKTPLIIQSEQSECGLACLAMVASFHGYETDLTELRRDFSLSLKGATLSTIIDFSKKLGFISRALRIEIEDIPYIQTPAILHWDMNHFVVLTKVKNKTIKIHDPAFGEKTISRQSLDKHFTGVVLELSPGPDFAAKKIEKRVSFRKMIGSISGIKKSISQIFLVSLVLQLLLMAPPYYSQIIFDDVIVEMDEILLDSLFLLFGTLAFIIGFIEILRSRIVLHFSTQLNYQMGTGLFWHLVNLPADYFEKRHIGDIVSRFSSLEKIRNFLSEGIVQSIIDGLMCSITFIIMMTYSPPLSFVVFVLICFFSILRFSVVQHERKLNESLISNVSKEQSNFIETIRGIKTIKLFSHEKSRFWIWQDFFINNINSEIKISSLNINIDAFRNIIFGLENIIMLYFGANMVIKGSFTVGMLVAFTAYKLIFVEKINNFLSMLIEFRVLKLHLRRLVEVTSESREDAFDNIPVGLNPILSGKLSVKDLSFRYASSEPYIFSNINFTVQSGEFVAITGSSGVGKSTLLKILIGLKKPSMGHTYIDDFNVNKISKQKYRANISTVMQDDQLLSGTLWQNICFFDEGPDLEWIYECAKMAAIHDDIMEMPMSYHSLIGDMGTALSGGQKQRILIARALYRKPRIIFLDEATSNLDSSTEEVIYDSISSLNITRLIVAHRLSTIRSADRALRLERDKIIDVTHQYK